MNPGLGLKAVLVVSGLLAIGSYACSFADELETAQPLTLVDLADYCAAISGRATDNHARAADAPPQVVFGDLWNRTDQFRGHLVTVGGQVTRIFRQGPVGSFPPLVEVWITSPSGDPFCVVFPQPSQAAADHEQDPVADHMQGARPIQIPELGHTIRFTGTFLKMVRYAARDGARLAPLVVGDRLPELLPRETGGTRSSAESAAALICASSGNSTSGDGREQPSWPQLRWVLGLTLVALAASILVRRQMRSTLGQADSGYAALNRRTAFLLPPDPPLEFIEPGEKP